MMDPRTIAANDRAAARKSAKDKLIPYMVHPHDLDFWRGQVEAGKLPQLPFPALGDRHPRGYRLLAELFVDTSGFGSECEPAMTPRRLIMEELKADLAYSIGSCGQFQAWVRVWAPPGSSARR